MRVPSRASAVVLCGAIITMAVSPALAQRGGREAARSRADAYWIGARCFEVPDVARAQLDLPADRGVLVDDVVSGAPAEKAGLRKFDVIVSIDGEPLADPKALADAVAVSAGKELALECLRGGKQQVLTIKPERRPIDLPPTGHGDIERAMRQWLERPDRPMSLRFFHPGMILSPDAAHLAGLPDDMTVTIEKRGGRPAEITAERGEESWQATEESLDQLPPEARQYVERMLGASMYGLPAFSASGQPQKAEPAAESGDAHERLKQRLDELDQLKRKIGEIDELRREIEQSR
jgi:membrane-associated protease RseP (regulator of RpoE activity)